jgi:hypothetical protein
MKRRTILQLGAAGLAGLTLSRAGEAGGDGGPLFLHLQAGGGWDPTLLCDPRPDVNKLAFSAAQTTTTSAGHSFSYADLGGTSTPLPKDLGYNFGTFFETYRDQLLVINGIFTRSVGHRSGGRYAASGRVAAGYPALAAIVAADKGLGMAMPLLVLGGGGYSETRGHVTPTRIDGDMKLSDLAHPNVYANGSAKFYTDSEHNILTAARAARLQRLIDGDTRAPARTAMQRLAWARSHTGQLETLVAAIDQGPNVSLPAVSNKNRSAHHIFRNGFLAIAAYEQGLSQAGVMSVGSFDTHAAHDALHPWQLQNVLFAVDLLMQEAASRNVDMVLLITSEFGRTAKYNVADGKDHWPVTSWMILQTPGLDVITPGRLVGASSYDEQKQHILACDLDPASLEIGQAAGDSPLTPGMCHLGLRQRLGLEDSTLADHNYPLVGPDVSRVFTG